MFFIVNIYIEIATLALLAWLRQIAKAERNDNSINFELSEVKIRRVRLIFAKHAVLPDGSVHKRT